MQNFWYICSFSQSLLPLMYFRYFLLKETLSGIILLSISTLFISNECEELQNHQMLKLFDSSFMLYITTKRF